MSSFASAMVEQLFASALAEEIEFVPKVGGSYTLRAIPVEIDVEADSGRFNPGVSRKARAFDILASDISAEGINPPRKDDLVYYLGNEYQLQSNSAFTDSHELIYRVECYAV